MPEGEEILPEENLVLSVSGEKTIFKRIKVLAEYANSALTRDTRIEERENSPNNIFGYVGNLYTQRESSSYYNAFKSSLQYTAEKFGLGLNYERIDPGYKTHGSYFRKIISLTPKLLQKFRRMFFRESKWRRRMVRPFRHLLT